MSTPGNPQRQAIPWATVPLLLPVVALAAGILGASFLQYRYAPAFLGVTVVLSFLVIALHLRPRPDGKTANTASVLVLLAIFAFGGWYAGERHPLNDERHFSHCYAPGDQLLGTLTAVRPGERLTTTEVRVTGVIRQDSVHPAKGNLLAYLPSDTVAIGDEILLAAEISVPTGPLNPGAFDYAAYLANKNIFHRTYPDSLEWTRVSHRSALTLTAIGDRSREAWFASLQPYLDGDDLAVAAALIMGKRDLLGTEVKSAYADTGAIHVLAVSGLHVGILALLVTQLLRLLLPPRPVWLAVRAVATVLLVWYFALVTGLSASVQRAALMVTVVIIGKSMNRNNNIFNLLAIAALVMLVVEPKQLFQVGFQLSFAAVAGIALFTRGLQKLVYLPGKLRIGWDAISVSTAAQLGTLPLSLYYFGQFPVYFMLSGTLVIVFAYLVLALGLLHGFLAGIGAAGGLLEPTGTLLRWVVKVQNEFIFYCRQLPGATLQITEFGLLSAVGLFLLIACVAYLVFRPSHRARWAAMSLTGLLCGYWLLGPVISPTPPQFTVYHLPRKTLIDVYDGRHGIGIGDRVEDRQLIYNVLPSRERFGTDFAAHLAFTTDTILPAATVAYPLLRLLDRRVLLLDRNARPRLESGLPEVDLVILRNGFSPRDLPVDLPEVPVVIDGSNPPYVADRWRETDSDVHVTAEQGAYRYVITE
ncbi:competence protein ComEC [Lewinella aquimaris]|uniref:Competence protein ComEC n=1 Tax=Neolewinella aquimaris TaxID=1835722 RepID=A0A840E6W4_9BACT|nr:ComEC/Rec2 family competence protein [Neolewinella aquimaris]MBB4078957.1 competence protein ComEC [Neolewinella aquimaris]